MDNKISNLTEVFNTFFYKKFTFILDNKILREGRLKLFTQKGFNLKFFITEDGDDIKVFEIPSCGEHTLIHSDGCVQCISCGWSKCG